MFSYWKFHLNFLVPFPGNLATTSLDVAGRLAIAGNANISGASIGCTVNPANCVGGGRVVCGGES